MHPPHKSSDRRSAARPVFAGSVVAAAILSACQSRPVAPSTSASPQVWTWNGRDLSGWKGLVADSPKRASMSPAALVAAQALADRRMRDHWRPIDGGVLHFDGLGDNLCTARDYRDFELSLDWKIPPKGDSGIYLRGSPQVQIWDNPIGSGGLYNNQLNPRDPLTFADRPPGEWNTFLIRMQGQFVTVWLNGQLVVDRSPLENYWERDKPIYPSGPIELQNHGGELWFRNIVIRELPPS